ncbi:ribose-phosphate pyrophosphokinase [Sedimentibacter saalensis]|jgi:ribose-phosphate pyrophosphokinase|uniref:ribose-phosphate diphosphokinase n=2 Tax=root TaxID=1 RepID=A0A562JLF4_9FIRM|nr:ribose-phosphate pyrophosphokinase [Sedimentibacter saalensis]MEA5096441.1 ribose-phosphate pyrophosphokinase [Sedimentibacter saalensis]TWH83823.1 ribose-phosphate pyrophosphokinase [Sedimentibacter saalensis]
MNINDYVYNEPKPFGDLSIVAMKGCEEIAAKIDYYLKEWRQDNNGVIYSEGSNPVRTYLLDAVCPRFGSGEAKGVINETVRGHDIFIISDVFNYGVKFKMYGMDVPMSPDDHYQDLKRVIAAMNGKAKRITVIMPMLYEGRQHKRASRESLDCALALQELTNMGVENIISFDIHDPRVQNAIPLHGFEDFHPHYQMIKAFVRTVTDATIDRNHLMVISPDEGGMTRCMYYASVMGLDLGMFYKRRDYSVIVNGKNPVISHEFLGDNVEGKDVIVVDDMIASGDSMIDVAKKLKERKARNVYVFSSFGLFTEGFDKFDKAFEEGTITRIFTSNMIYRKPELLQKPWYTEVDMSKYIANIIDTLNYDRSLSELLDPVQKIKKLLK